MLEDLARDMDRLLDACLECVTRESVSRQKCCIFQQVDGGCWSATGSVVLLLCYLGPGCKVLSGHGRGHGWWWNGPTTQMGDWGKSSQPVCELWSCTYRCQISSSFLEEEGGMQETEAITEGKRKQDLRLGLGGGGEGGSPRVRKWGEASSDPYVIQRKYIRFMVHQVYIARPSTCLLFISWQNLRIIRLWMT